METGPHKDLNTNTNAHSNIVYIRQQAETLQSSNGMDKQNAVNQWSGILFSHNEE